MDDATADPGPLDGRVLHRLAAELRSQEAATRFCVRFLQLLPSRLDRLGSALAAGEPDAASDVAMSLAVTSATLGGTRLTTVAREVERLLRAGDLTEATALQPRLREEAAALAAALRRALPGPDPGHEPPRRS